MQARQMPERACPARAKRIPGRTISPDDELPFCRGTA
jgi:hypothetical protein